jgi:hypothetical protein
MCTSWVLPSLDHQRRMQVVASWLSSGCQEGRDRALCLLLWMLPVLPQAVLDGWQIHSCP